MKERDAIVPFREVERSKSEQIMEMPEYIEKGMKADFPANESKGVCLFAVGPTLVSAQFVVDVSNRYPFLVLASLNERVPGWLGEGTDAVVMAYSGNTQMMIDTYRKLSEKGCRIHCMTSSGALEEMCREDGNHLIELPKDMAARSAVPYEIGVLASLLRSLGAPYLYDSLSSVLSRLRAYRDAKRKDMSEVVRVSDILYGRIPAIYSSIDTVAAAKRWKISINEDAESPAFYGEIPEFDHNEIVGWADPNMHAKGLRMVVLRMNSGIPEFEYTMDSMMRTLEEYDREILCIDFPDEDRTLSELKAMLFGDMVALELRRRKEVSEWKRRQ